jgi:hypothetical protein
MPRKSRDALRAAALVVAAVVCVGSVNGRLAEARRRVKETSEVALLPPPEQVVSLSLGYRAALADVLWARVLVTQGLRRMEKRRFEELPMLLDAINELDPTFRDPYLYAAALMTLQGAPPTREEVLKTRAILERGAKNRPLDAEVWLALGQFVAFMAPNSYLTDEDEKRQWRVEGAKMLARAAELGGGRGR